MYRKASEEIIEYIYLYLDNNYFELMTTEIDKRHLVYTNLFQFDCETSNFLLM